MKRTASARRAKVRAVGKWIEITEPTEEDCFPDSVVFVRADYIGGVVLGNNVLEPDVRCMQIKSKFGEMTLANADYDEVVAALQEAER
jgi:hypothetical protein